MDNRHKMAHQLLARGWGTMDQLLEASFGEWPPKGLDIVHAHPQVINLTTSLKTFKPDTSALELIRDTLMVGGYAWLNGDRKIFINRLMYPLGRFSSTLGHEAAHILQGDHYWRADEIMGKDGMQAYMPRQNTASELIIDHAIADHFKKGKLRAVFNKVADTIGFGISYFRQGVEIQARLHEALMAGYPHWERMPQNQSEFYFAMQSLGFSLTPQIREKMNTLPDKDKLREVFAPAGHLLPLLKHKFVSDIAKVEANLTTQGKERLWALGMPELYCDLIEMYGDRLGRERFGYGLNEINHYRSRHSDDLKTIRETEWSFSSNEKVGRYAYLQLDTLGQQQQRKILAALDNHYIAVDLQTENPPLGRSWLFISGDHWLKKLDRIIQPTNTVPALKQSAIQKQTL